MQAPRCAQGWRVARSLLPLFHVPFQRQQANDYDDINGREVGSALTATGWEYLGATLRLDALASTCFGSERYRQEWVTVASAWAGLIRTHEGAVGLNLSYAVEPAHRGKGLSVLLSCCATIEYAAAGTTGWRSHPWPTFVNIQCRTTNDASLATARALGVPACPEAAFTVTRPRRDDVRYLGFREPLERFLERGIPIVASRVPGYDAGALSRAPWLALSLGSPRPQEEDPTDTLSLTESTPHL